MQEKVSVRAIAITRGLEQAGSPYQPELLSTLGPLLRRDGYKWN